LHFLVLPVTQLLYLFVIFDVLPCAYGQNYPRHRHPGWNKGSIAYHAGMYGQLYACVIVDTNKLE